MVTPNGSESWDTGSTHTIKWTSTGGIANVDIHYSTDRFAADENLIVSSTTNDGSYDWAIGGGLTPGSTYTIRVRDTSATAINDESNQFSITAPVITAPAITVVSPNDTGIDIPNETTHLVEWTKTESISTVDIKLYKAAVYDSDISLGVSGTSYAWKPSGITAGTDYKVEVVDAGGSGIKDQSDNDFEISAQKTITVTAPASGAEFDPGTANTITWTSAGNIDNVKIDIYKDGTKILEIIDTTTDDGSYDWTPDKSFTRGSDYKIRISDVDNTVTYGESSAFSLGLARVETGETKIDVIVNGVTLAAFDQGNSKVQFDNSYPLGYNADYTPTANRHLATKGYVDDDSPGSILAYTHLNPTVIGSYTLTTSYAVIDNGASVTFTVPTSGNVLVDFQVFRDSSSSSKSLYFGLSTAASYTTLGAAYEKHISKADRADDFVIQHSWVVEGLTNDTSTTYYIGARTDTTVQYLKWGGTSSNDYPPMIIKVTALP